jgi:hypothetical protein
MNLRKYLALFLLLSIYPVIHADILAELSKKDRNSAVTFDWPIDFFSIYMENGYLITEVWEEGMAVEILSFTNTLANQNRVNSALLNLYDYMYRVSVNGRELMVNGYYLDFSNRIKLF